MMMYKHTVTGEQDEDIWFTSGKNLNTFHRKRDKNWDTPGETKVITKMEIGIDGLEVVYLTAEQLNSWRA